MGGCGDITKGDVFGLPCWVAGGAFGLLVVPITFMSAAVALRKKPCPGSIHLWGAVVAQNLAGLLFLLLPIVVLFLGAKAKKGCCEKFSFNKVLPGAFVFLYLVLSCVVAGMSFPLNRKNCTAALHATAASSALVAFLPALVVMIYWPLSKCFCPSKDKESSEEDGDAGKPLMADDKETPEAKEAPGAVKTEEKEETEKKAEKVEKAEGRAPEV